VTPAAFLREAMRAGGPAGVLIAIVCGLAACVDRLPDQDLRILSSTPVAKLSADILWKEYQSNREAADDAYWGKALVVTGAVTRVGSDAPTDRFVLFGQTEEFGVRANLLEEQAAGILEAAAENKRLTLKCFCEGLSGHVVLKSCVIP
jgi:hypothetical protein